MLVIVGCVRQIVDRPSFNPGTGEESKKGHVVSLSILVDRFAMMHAAVRCCAGALRAAKPTLLKQKLTETTTKSIAAYQTTRMYIVLVCDMVTLMLKYIFRRSPRDLRLAR